MGKARPSRRKIHGVTFTFILIISAIVVPLSILIKPSVSEPPWWNENWNFRKQIIIDHTKVIADLENFPVLIDMIDPDLIKAKNDGSDIVFTIDQNSTLNHEIEFYDSNSGHLVAWVQLPSLSSSEDTVLYMYYGNPSAPSQQNPTAVWDANYTMVQHLEETSTANRFDSTINSNNGVAYGGVVKSSNGKIDGADNLDGVDDYISISNSPSLNPVSAITIELWINLGSTANYINLASKGSYSQYYLRAGASQGYIYWYVKFSDNSTKAIEGNIGWKWNTWHYLVATADTQIGTIKVYLDGVEKLNGTFPTGKTIISTTNPLLISDSSQRRIKGAVDEVRISNTTRSAAWIQTACNNQKDPTQFYIVGGEESRSQEPLIFENPQNEATDVYTNPTLSAKIINPQDSLLTIIFKERISSLWVDIATYENVPSGTYYANATQMKNLGVTYYWSVCVYNGIFWTNKTYSLTTTAKILQQKWIAKTGFGGVSGVLAADINKDGIDEVLYAGKGGVIALNGKDGSTIWKVVDSSIGDHAQPQMADLNNDGILEIIIPLESPAGLLVLYANNGSTYWRLQSGLGKETYASPVVFDIDGNGYPTIFIASTDISSGLSGTGRISAVSYDGRILYQNFVWRPCSGGLSIADTDGDGEFEIYMGERNMYLNDPQYGDNDYGKGVVSFWARNLTIRWYRPEIFCSSQIPMIADVNNDGILDIIIGDLEGGLAVLNATDGSTIKMTRGIPQNAPTHYQPCVYDIDGDGNLEMLMADPHDTTSDDLVIWDLVKWQIDARIYIGKCFYGPQVADVTGDGVMEIIACNYKSIFIIDKTYRIIDGIVGLSGDITQEGQLRNIDGISMLAGTLNYAVAQDIDGDGYNEVVVSTQSGDIYAFDTPARRPNPRPRTEVQFYSEYRLGAAEYVQPQAGPTPVITSPSPPNLAQNIPITLSTLNFTITDYQRDPMNITITTNPNIGDANLINTGNGRYTINITNLQYSTTYQWIISATDGTHWTNKTYTFTTQDFSPWWNPEWQYRKTIIIDHTKTNTDLSDFPILIDITDNDLKTKAQTNGQDIAFTDSNGIQLNHEIEQYDSSTGHLTAWVKIPLLSSKTDTKLYMYYGNPTATNQQNLTAVWDSNFAMVQHLEETSTSRLDSTINGNNGTAYNGISKTSEKIDGADQFDGINDYINFVSSTTLNPATAITVELWMKLSSTGDFINLVSKGGWSQYYLRLGPSEGRVLWNVKFSDGTSAGVEGFNTGWKWNTWHYIVAIADTTSGTVKVYLDGVEKLSGTFASGKTLIATTNPLRISDTTRMVKGGVDEVRISNVARSLAWIQTSYNNQKEPTQFYTIGGEEPFSSLLIIYSPSPPDKATNISPSTSQLSFSIASPQGNLNYTVTTDPDIGSGSDINIPSGKYSINISGLQYSQTYKWTVTITNGTHQTSRTFTFTTYPSEPPTQSEPILVKTGNNIVCYNQSTTDPDGDKVTNIYNWYRNGISITNLLLPFETNTTTTVKDYSGYNNHGTIIQDVTWTPNGIVGGAYNFNRGYIQIPGTNTLDGGGTWSEITVEAWIKITAYPQSGTSTRIIARIPSYEIGITSAGQLFASIWTATGNPMISGLNQLTYNTTLQLNAWYHITLTYKKGMALTLFINGTAVATKTPSESSTLNYNIQPSGPNPLYIGWFDYFKGTIDEVRIYPKSLTPQQIYQRYSETKDGQTNSSTIVQAELLTGDVWQCKVTPNDSHQDGTTKTSNPITIGQNNKPSAKNLTITPQTPNTNDDLIGNYTFFDPDGDPENTTLTEIRWYRNDVLVPELNNTLTIPSSYTTKGEIWYFTVKPSDGTEFGDTYESTHIVVQNTPPAIDSYYPLTDPTINEGETQEFNITQFDPDGDYITVQWYLNGTQTVTTDFYIFEANCTSAGTYNVTVVISDGVDEDSHEWTLTVLDVNQPPVITSWYPSTDPDPIYVGNPQEFNITCSDPDGDILTIQWYVNETLKGEWTGNTSIIFQPDQASTYIIKVVVSDGQDETPHIWTLTVEQPP